MPNPKKVEFVDNLTQKFEDASAIYFTNYKGMDVQTTNELRSIFFENDVEYKVAKKTLTKMAAENAGYDDIEELIDGQMAIAFTYEDPVIPAKLITKFSEDNGLDYFEITGCIFEDQFYPTEKIDEIKELPTRKELITQFANVLKSPMRKLLQTLNSPMNNLVNTLKSLKEDKE